MATRKETMPKKLFIDNNNKKKETLMQTLLINKNPRKCKI